MWILLALIACKDLSIEPEDEVEDASEAIANTRGAARSVIPEVVEMPEGSAVYRGECFGGGQYDGAKRTSKPSGRGGGGAPSPAPQAAPAADMASGAAPMEEAEEAAAPEPEPVAAEKSEVALGEIASSEDEADRDEAASERKRPPRDEPDLDWGATVFLSNDDSMSLASAQRVLWAADQGRRLSVSQIRPHELLNYFTFDTTEVAKGDLFSVNAVARETGDDTLSLALAVKGTTPPRVPLDLTLVVDRSGSMSAEGRMEYTKRALTLMTDQLERGDRVDVVLFDNSVCTALEDYVVGRDDASLLTQTISQMSPRGSTDLDSGLKEGYRLATAREGGIARNQRVMLFTDAWLNTGDVDPNTVTEVGKAYEDRGIRLTGVGVGREFNDTVLDMLTEKGKGAYVYLGTEAVVDRLFGVGFDSLTRTIAHNVNFSIDLPDSLAMERFYGEESSTVKEDIQPIHYYAGTTQLFLQDLKMRNPKRGDTITFIIEYRDAATEEPATEKVKLSLADLQEADPHNLYKARALMSWTDLLLAQAMGGDACGEPLATYKERAGKAADDAEIGYVNTLVKETCPRFDPTPAPETVSYKVKLDSDTPIAEVKLDCGGTVLKKSLSASDTVARFDAPAGECKLVLGGAVPMEVAVVVPETGGDVRCTVRGGRVSCGG